MEGRGGRRRTSFSSSKGKGWITHQQDEISCTEDGTPRGEAAVVDEEGSESFNNNKQKVLGVENNSDGQEAMGRTNKNGEVEDNVKKKKEKKTDISSMTLNNQPTKKQEKDSGGRQPDSRYDGEEAEKEEEVEVEKLKAEVATLRSRLNAAEGKNNNSESSTTTTTTSDYGDGKPDAAFDDSKGIDFAPWGNTSMTRVPKGRCAAALLLSYASGNKKWKERVLVFYPKGLRIVKPYTELLCHEYKWKHVQQWAINPAKNLAKFVVEQVDLATTQTYTFKIVDMDVERMERIIWRFVSKGAQAADAKKAKKQKQKENSGSPRTRRKGSKDSPTISRKGSSAPARSSSSSSTGREYSDGGKGTGTSFWQRSLDSIRAFRDFVVNTDGADLGAPPAAAKGRKDSSGSNLFRKG